MSLLHSQAFVSESSNAALVVARLSLISNDGYVAKISSNQLQLPAPGVECDARGFVTDNGSRDYAALVTGD
jgi:hypothetical protein